MGYARSPCAVPVNAGARSLAGKNVGSGHDPIKGRAIMEDALDQSSKIAEELPNLLPAGGKTRLREKHLGIVSEQVKNAGACRNNTLVIERLQVLHGRKTLPSMRGELVRDAAVRPPRSSVSALQ